MGRKPKSEPTPEREQIVVHEGSAPLVNKGDERNPWLDVPHAPIWLDAVSPEGKEQLVCGDCGMRKDK